MKIILADNTISTQRIADLFNSAHLLGDFMATDEKVTSDKVAKMLLNKAAYIFLAVGDDESFAGFCLIGKKTSPEFSHRAFIQAISVVPEMRGKGIASKLIEAVIAWARNNNIELLSLEVVDANISARKLYEKFSFKEGGVLPDGFRRDGISYEIVNYYLSITSK